MAVVRERTAKPVAWVQESVFHPSSCDARSQCSALRRKPALWPKEIAQ
jgi:hypothetical protein